MNTNEVCCVAAKKLEVSITSVFIISSNTSLIRLLLLLDRSAEGAGHLGEGSL